MNQQLCPLLSHCGKQAFGHICTPPLLTEADSAGFKGMYSAGFLLLSSQHLWCFTVFIDLSCVCVWAVHATAGMWKSEDLWESVLPFHRAVLGLELRLSGLMASTLPTKPSHETPIVFS